MAAAALPALVVVPSVEKEQRRVWRSTRRRLAAFARQQFAPAEHRARSRRHEQPSHAGAAPVPAPLEVRDDNGVGARQRPAAPVVIGVPEHSPAPQCRVVHERAKLAPPSCSQRDEPVRTLLAASVPLAPCRVLQPCGACLLSDVRASAERLSRRCVVQSVVIDGGEDQIGIMRAGGESRATAAVIGANVLKFVQEQGGCTPIGLVPIETVQRRIRRCCGEDFERSACSAVC